MVNSKTYDEGELQYMENFRPIELAILCDILQSIISEIEDDTKKNLYLKVEKVLLELFGLTSLSEVHDYYSVLDKNKQIEWCLDTISKHNLFSITNRLATKIDINQSINFNALLTNLKDEDKNNNQNDKIIQSLCFLILLNVVSFSCDNSEQLLERYSEEKNILEKKNLFQAPHKNLFLIILYCIEILKIPRNTIPLKITDFNKDLYYSSSITYLNNLKNEIYKTSQETNHKVSNFYSKILEIVGLLIAIFSIIGVNCFTIASQSNIDPFNIVLVNSSLAMSLSIVLFLIHNIIHERRANKFLILLFLSFLVFLITIILYLIKNNIFILHFNV